MEYVEYELGSLLEFAQQPLSEAQIKGLMQQATKAHSPLVARRATVSAPHKFTVVATKKVVKKVQVVLTKQVDNVGAAGALVEVPAGYFRNYLLPQGHAKPATGDILAQIAAENAKNEAAKAAAKAEAQMLATALQTIGKFTIKKKAGEGEQKDKLFGSVTSVDVVEAVKMQTNQELDKRNIDLPEIREAGNFPVTVKLHPEVTASFTLVVQGVRE